VVTIEKAASAKVFFECYYNGLTSIQLTPRSLRRRQLEGALYQDSTLPQTEKDERRRTWAEDETDHLRETRVMKARSGKIMKGKDTLASKYEVVKILGKGSFGVVRLVRERSENLWVKQAIPTIRFSQTQISPAAQAKKTNLRYESHSQVRHAPKQSRRASSSGA
jgi:hypothetical protein